MSFVEYRLKQAPSGLRKVLYMNWPLVVLVIAVASVGFLMLYSIAGGSLDPWARRQMHVFAAGMVLMFVVAMVPIWFWRNMAGLAYLVAFVLLILVEIMGETNMGAQRWIDLGFMQFQPSEMMKFTLVMLLAAYYDGLDHRKVSRPLYVLVPALLIVAPAVMVFYQPNLGTSLLLLLAGAAVMFAAGVSLWYFGAVLAFVVAVIVGVFTLRGTPWQFLHDYQYTRIDTFLNPGADPLGDGYNIIQAKIALGSGGWSGKGLPAGKGDRLHLHHPGRGVRVHRRLLAFVALRADHRLLPGGGVPEPRPVLGALDRGGGGQLLLLYRGQPVDGDGPGTRGGRAAATPELWRVGDAGPAGGLRPGAKRACPQAKVTTVPDRSSWTSSLLAAPPPRREDKVAKGAPPSSPPVNKS